MRELGITYTKKEREQMAKHVLGQAGHVSSEKAEAKMAQLRGNQ